MSRVVKNENIFCSVVLHSFHKLSQTMSDETSTSPWLPSGSQSHPSAAQAVPASPTQPFTDPRDLHRLYMQEAQDPDQEQSAALQKSLFNGQRPHQRGRRSTPENHVGRQAIASAPPPAPPSGLQKLRRLHGGNEQEVQNLTGQQCGSFNSHGRPVVRTPASLSMEQLIEIFDRASLECSPPPRLLIARARQPGDKESDQEGALIPLPHCVADWIMTGVVQRTRDVDFVISVPYISSFNENAIRNSKQKYLTMNICYDPERDECELINRSHTAISVTGLWPPRTQDSLRPKGRTNISPGIWRVTTEAPEQHLVDFLVLRRRFMTSMLASSTKRSSTEVNLLDGKRQKLHKTGFVLTPSGVENTSVRNFDERQSTESSVEVSLTPASLLRLTENSTIAIRSLHGSGSSKLPSSSSYNVTAIHDIYETPSSRVFACRHSALQGCIVAKVAVHKGATGEPTNLSACAQLCIRESDFLESLHHVSSLSSPNLLWAR